MAAVFEKIINDISKVNAETYLQDYMSFDPEKVSKIPTRYRLIAFAFVKKMSLEELNAKLLEAGCEALYARNFWEASLIYAFSKGYSYEKWAKLQEGLKKEGIEPGESAWFTSKAMGVADLKEYVLGNSVQDEEQLVTVHETVIVEEKLKNLEDEEQAFYDFMRENIKSFSPVREKTRYYFCKYLYYYLNQKIENYMEMRNDHYTPEDCYSELAPFKGISDLTRKKLTDDQARELLLSAGISCGGIYDDFNQYYFEYISDDWMSVLIDYYGDIRSVPESDKKKFAASLRAYNKAWAQLTDEEILANKQREMDEKEAMLDQAYSLDGSSRGYQMNRSGENSVRNYIKGALDIDRTTLICYLIFFNSYLDDVNDNQKIETDRLNEILISCHMPKLRDGDDFDNFVINYLKAKDPTDYLMESVTNYAFEQKNFFLYHMYNDSISNETQLKKVMGI